MALVYKKAWFTARYFGRGWYPSSWEGWAISLAYVTFCVGIYLKLDEPLSFILIGILSLIFIFICLKKGRQPNSKEDGKEKNWRAGKLG